MEFNPERRRTLKQIVSSLGILLLDGCGIGGNSSIVQPLKEPGQVLSNPYLGDLRNIARGEGHQVSLSTEFNPPVISGKYSIGGRIYYPNQGELSSGTFTWRNQTSDNHIETEYNQILGQSGISSYGEIIRGQGRIFTVYSRLRITEQPCDEIVDMVIDGSQDGSGNVSAVYFGLPIGELECFSPSVGHFNLTLNDALRELRGGFSLINLLS